MIIPHSKPWIIAEDETAICNLLRTGMLAQGEEVRRFERSVAAYFGAEGAVATGSGTAALILSLLTLGIKGGDEVILPTYVCRAVLDSVLSVGATPVLSDVGDNWNMTQETVTACITKKTRAIILVHIYGIAADLDTFLDVDVPIIEDCCQAFGAEINGKKVGSLGAISTFSFHATKCLTSGEGGMIITHQQELLERARYLLENSTISSRLSDIQASLGYSQLCRYHEMIQRRKHIAQDYLDAFPQHLTSGIRTVSHRSVFFRFPLSYKFESFKCIQKEFEKYNVHVRRGVDSLLHHELGLNDRDFPVASELFQRTLSIPIYPALHEREVRQVISAVKILIEEKGAL